MKIISRKQAQHEGLKYYFSGKPCNEGHISLRRVSNYTCLECEKINEQKYQPIRRKLNQKYRETHKEKVKQAQSLWIEKNRDALRAQQKEYRQQNPEKIRENSRRYYQNNPSKHRARNAKRRALKLNATPQWCELEKIKCLYEEARNKTTETGILHVVDHIVPLQGKNVCGLHCFDNLQIITCQENRLKWNYWPLV